MRLLPTPIPGCFEIEAFQATDQRGTFTKVFSAGVFTLDRLPALQLGEVFLTRSSRGVLRGMHLQEPPFDQHKVIFCVAGEAFDVLLDLRIGSPTERRSLVFTLSADSGRALLVPPGVAHGFLALEDDTLMLYCTTAQHSPEHDTGVRWDSIGVTWPSTPALVSERDWRLQRMDDYQSPFPFRREGSK